jgi:hypothetical protein
MRSVFAAFAALAALAPLAQTSAIPYRRFDRRWNDAYPGDVTTDPLPPSKDPFYQLPDSVKSAKNGDVLKSRPVWTQVSRLSLHTQALGANCSFATVRCLLAGYLPALVQDDEPAGRGDGRGHDRLYSAQAGQPAADHAAHE